MTFDLRSITKKQALLVLVLTIVLAFWWASTGRDLLVDYSTTAGTLGQLIIYYVSQYGAVVLFFYLAVHRSNHDG